MADELRKTIRSEIIVDADKALQDAQKFREAIEQVKSQLRDLGATSQESLNVVSAAFKDNLASNTLAPLKQQISETKAELSDITATYNQYAAALQGTNLSEQSSEIQEFISSQNTAVTQLQSKLAGLEQEYARITKSVTLAQQELQKEFRKNAEAAKKSFGDAGKAAKEFRANVNAAKSELQQLVVGGASLDDAFQGLKTTGRYELNQLSQAMREVKQETKEAEEETEKYSKSTIDMGNVVQRVFRSIIGFLVLNVLRRLLDLYGQVTQAGKEFADSMLEISTAVRSLQRAGIDITMQETAEAVENLSMQFGVFTKRDLQAGLSNIFDLGRQLGYTKEQMFALAEATAYFATKNNKDFVDSINQVTTALVNGQTRGLKGLDLAISEQQIKQEAYRLELANVGEELDATAKSQALYSLILQEYARNSGDVVEIQKLLSVQYKTEETALQNLKDAIGTQLLPAKIAFYKVVNRALEGLMAFTNFMRDVSIPVNRALAYVVVGAAEAIRAFGAILAGNENALDGFTERVQKAVDAYTDFITGFAPPAQEQDNLGLGDFTGQIDEYTDELEGAGDELSDAYNDLFIKLRESIIDGNEDIEKEARRLEDTLEDIETRLAQKLLELRQKLIFDSAKIQRDYLNKLEDINNKYRDREIDAEQKYQDKLRSLRAKFLFELEDALAERDARQIIRLIRQFKLNQDELKRQKDSERRDLEEERQREIRDLQLQRDRRLQELALEFAFRRTQALQQAQWDAEQAEIENERRLREIQIATDQRNAEIIRRFSDQYTITDQWAKAIGDRLAAEFGPGGRIDNIYEYFYKVMKAISDSINSLNTMHINPELKYLQPGAPGNGFAEGGTLVATKPTLALFGEAGPEKVDFTPLTKPGANVGKVFGGTLAAPSRAQAMLQMMISLSPGLEAEIVEKALGGVADIIVDTNRQRL